MYNINRPLKCNLFWLVVEDTEKCKGIGGPMLKGRRIMDGLKEQYSTDPGEGVWLST